MTEFNTSPRFVTADDYFNYTGKDLNAELQSNENESNKADLFLKNIEDELMARIDRISFRVYDYDNLPKYQAECFRRAIIQQAYYVLRNSELSSDSGYDLEKGVIIPRATLEEIMLSPAAKDTLISCGLLNHVIRNRRRYLNF